MAYKEKKEKKVNYFILYMFQYRLSLSSKIQHLRLYPFVSQTTDEQFLIETQGGYICHFVSKRYNGI